MKKVLFVCTGNSCRSQMAEGWCRHLYGDRIQVHSAGLKAQGINPFAIEVMNESGVDISTQRSEDLDQFNAEQFDLVVTLCGHANEHCPVFQNSKQIHQPFDDPPHMANGLTDKDQQLDCYRQVRDQIAHWLGDLESLLSNPISKESITC